MKTILPSFVVFAVSICNPHAETFSSSTNFVQTLTIGTNEAIFVTTMKQSDRSFPGGGRNFSVLEANVARSNQTVVLPVGWQSVLLGYSGISLPAFAGPMAVQFQHANVWMEFQRIQTTNVFTAVFNSSNGVVIDVPAGKSINFLAPTSWNNIGNSEVTSALITLSNSVTVLTDTVIGHEKFSGPLTISLVPGFLNITPIVQTNGWVTYYFTEEFAALPNIGATLVPAGKSMITIEKSQDLVHWGTAFFTVIGSDQSGFYRFNFAK